jgi:hypothetical protein
VRVERREIGDLVGMDPERRRARHAAGALGQLDELAHRVGLLAVRTPPWSMDP